MSKAHTVDEEAKSLLLRGGIINVEADDDCAGPYFIITFNDGQRIEIRSCCCLCMEVMDHEQS